MWAYLRSTTITCSWVLSANNDDKNVQIKEQRIILLVYLAVSSVFAFLGVTLGVYRRKKQMFGEVAGTAHTRGPWAP